MVWAVLRVFAFMLEALEEFLVVVWHGYVEGTMLIIPILPDTTVQLSSPIDIKHVVFLKGG